MNRENGGREGYYEEEEKGGEGSFLSGQRVEKSTQIGVLIRRLLQNTVILTVLQLIQTSLPCSMGISSSSIG